MKTPDPPQIAPDPMLQQQQQQANRDQILSIQDRARTDTADLMSRYGALAAFASAAKG